MVLPRGALVNTLNKNVVQLLSHGDLSMLQLRQGVNHHGVLEVLFNHALKKLKVICGELRNALIERSCDLWVRSSSSRDDILDVLFALLHVDA